MTTEKDKKALASVIVILLLTLSAVPYASSASHLNLSAYNSGSPTGQVLLVASSQGNLFVGAVSDNKYLFVGLLNGSVERVDPQSGLVMAMVALPDRNSAAHLLYYSGSLYVGTEFLHGAKNSPPYHIYRIDPRTMQVLKQLAMNLRDANGFVFAFNGYLWAGDGACTLYKIEPNTLNVLKTVPGVAEDEMTYDGTYFWTECRNVVNVLNPGSEWSPVATGALPYPGRPRGFFMIGSITYSENSANFALYQMSISGQEVVFKDLGTFGNKSLVTRDTFLFNGLLYAYGTRDDKRFQPHVLVYDDKLSFKTAITLPGFGLPSDASQHSLFLLNGKIYFVTSSSIGYFVPLDGRALTSATISHSFSTTQRQGTITTKLTTADPFVNPTPNDVNIDLRLLILLMVVIGLIFTVIYLKRVKAIDA